MEYYVRIMVYPMWMISVLVALNLVVLLAVIVSHEKRIKNIRSEFKEERDAWDKELIFVFRFMRKKLEHYFGDATLSTGVQSNLPKTKVSSYLRYTILERDNFRCQLCGKSARENVELEVDHKLPSSRGGSNDAFNLWTLCKACNSGESDRIKAEWIEIEKVMMESVIYQYRNSLTDSEDLA